MRNCVDMSTLMLPAATMTTMTNTSPIAVAQPKADPVKGTLLGNNNNNLSHNKQGMHCSFCEDGWDNHPINGLKFERMVYK